MIILKSRHIIIIIINIINIIIIVIIIRQNP